MSIEFIADKDHYDKVVSKVASVKKLLWIGTVDIKALHVKSGNITKPFLGVLADLLKRGVEIRLIHAKEPGPAFREDFDCYQILKTGLERMLCPRVHFKMLIMDFNEAYTGSAAIAGDCKSPASSLAVTPTHLNRLRKNSKIQGQKMPALNIC